MYRENPTFSILGPLGVVSGKQLMAVVLGEISPMVILGGVSVPWKWPKVTPMSFMWAGAKKPYGGMSLPATGFGKL